MADLATTFNKCISAYANERAQGEAELKQQEEREDFAIMLLGFTQSQPSPQLAQFAAVILKNYVKRRWEPDEGPSVPEGTKAQVRQSIFQLMLSTAPLVAAQLRETIAVIAKHDFPAQWGDLLESLSKGLEVGYASQPAIVESTLLTCQKLFKHYRFAFRSDELWMEIKVVIDRLFQPFYNTAIQIYQGLQSASDPSSLNAHINAFLPLLKVFLSLNGQDIPQPFEDTLKDWMNLFEFLLNYSSPNLQEDNTLFLVKSKVLKCLTLFAQKYDEDFEPYVENFCKTVWDLLSKTSGKSEYDRFVSASLDFFRVVTLKPQISNLMHSNLSVFFNSLILPNMVLSEADEESAETEPFEFLKMFLEDANEDTRRHACSQLMKVLLKQFPEDVNKLVTEQQAKVANDFNANPTANWKHMDALILLLSGVYPTLYTPKNGATSIATTPQHIMELYSNLVAPQLTNVSFPILSTSCLKFIYVYRNQFPKEYVLNILNAISPFLESENTLVASYGSATLERLLMIKQDSEKNLLMTKEMLMPSINQLLQSLANALQKHPKNPYIMKAFFRVIWLSQDSFSPFAMPACEIFIDYLRQVMNNPQDSEPHFNWLVFECIALAVRYSSGQALAAVQEKIEPYMALIIQKSHPDLLPYAFQIQTLFVKLTGSLSQTNETLLGSVLPLHNWESGSRYYAPALVMFLESVLQYKPQNLQDQIKSLAAIIYQLFVLGLDGQAFSLLTALSEAYSLQQFGEILHQIYIVVFTKLHNAKEKNARLSPRFHKGAIMFVASFVMKHGAQALAESMNTVQQGIFNMLCQGEVAKNLRSVDTAVERKFVAVAITEILKTNIVNQEVWNQLCVNMFKMLEMQVNMTPGVLYSNGLVDLPEENSIQLAKESFQKIYSAEPLTQDKLPNIQNEKHYALQTLVSLQYPTGSFTTYIAPALDETTQNILYTYSQAFSIPLA